MIIWDLCPSAVRMSQPAARLTGMNAHQDVFTEISAVCMHNTWCLGVAGCQAEVTPLAVMHSNRNTTTLQRAGLLQMHCSYMRSVVLKIM